MRCVRLSFCSLFAVVLLAVAAAPVGRRSRQTGLCAGPDAAIGRAGEDGQLPNCATARLGTTACGAATD